MYLRLYFTKIWQQKKIQQSKQKTKHNILKKEKSINVNQCLLDITRRSRLSDAQNLLLNFLRHTWPTSDQLERSECSMTPHLFR